MADLIGKTLNFLGSLDLLGTLINEAQDYTVLEYSGGYDDALAHKTKLEKQGISCRLEGGNRVNNACVYTKRDGVR